MPDMRDEFEAWATSRCFSITKAPAAMMFFGGRRVPAGGYIMANTELAWKAWQASRAALRVEDEIDRLKAENEALRGALQAVVDDPTWRSNDNTLWPKIIKAMDKGATQ